MDHRADSVNPPGATRVPSETPQAQSAAARRLLMAGIIVLAVLELAWLVWFLIVPLPNANNTGVPTERAGAAGVGCCSRRCPKSCPIRRSASRSWATRRRS